MCFWFGWEEVPFIYKGESFGRKEFPQFVFHIFLTKFTICFIGCFVPRPFQKTIFNPFLNQGQCVCLWHERRKWKWNGNGIKETKTPCHLSHTHTMPLFSAHCFFFFFEMKAHGNVSLDIYSFFKCLLLDFIRYTPLEFFLFFFFYLKTKS